MNDEQQAGTTLPEQAPDPINLQDATPVAWVLHKREGSEL